MSTLSQKIDAIILKMDLLKADSAETQTPVKLVNEMLDELRTKIWQDNTKTFLDPACGRGVFGLCILQRLFDGLQLVIPDEQERLNHILRNQIFLCDISEVMYTKVAAAFARAIKAAGLVNPGINIYNENSLEHKFNMKFDVVVGNPPYKAGSHLKFMEHALEEQCIEGGHLVFIHPAEWLVQKRAFTSPKRKLYKQLRDRLMMTAQTDIHFVDNTFGDGAKLFVPLSITHVKIGRQPASGGNTFCDSRTTSYGSTPLQPMTGVQAVASLHNISRWTAHGDVEQLFISRVRERMKEGGAWEEQMSRQIGDHYVSLSAIAGDGTTDLVYLDGIRRKIPNMFSLVNKTTTDVLGSPCIAAARGGPGSCGSTKPFVSFSSREQAQHALDFICRTKFMRAYIAIIKIDQHAADALMDEIPWLDWTHEWSDDRLAQHFGLSVAERDLIDEILGKITV